MTAQWNPPTPIEDLFLQLREGQEFTTEGSETINDSQLLHLCYDNVNKTGLFNDALKIWRAKTTKNCSFFTTYMTHEHEDRMKNQITSASAGYSTNNVSTITDIVHKELEQFVNNMPFFQEDTNNENTNPNVPSPVVEQANATLTVSDIKDIFKSMMIDFQTKDRRGGRTPLSPSQGTDTDGNKTTYCWTHSITQISVTTVSLALVQRKATRNQLLSKTRWMAALTFAEEHTILLEKEGALKNKPF